MSIVTYNGVVLPYPYSTRFEQVPLRDESDTDWFCTKIDLQVECLISASYISMLAPELAGVTSNPADIMTILRTRLMQQRKTLSFVVNGVEMIPGKTAPHPSGTVDVMNGPKPQSCTLTQLNSTTFLMSYQIIAHYWEKLLGPGGLGEDPIYTNDPGANVLYNRWSETVMFDKYNMTVRSRSGVFRIRSDNLDGQVAADVIPEMAVVGVPKGFLRESSSYTVSPDGLTIKYEVSDKEQYKMPPPGAYEADGEYTEELSNTWALRYGSCRVRLKGGNSFDLVQLATAPDTFSTQEKLITDAIRIATKTLWNNGVRGRGIVGVGVPDMARLRVDLYNNEVEFYIRMMIKQDTASKININEPFNPIAAFSYVKTDTYLSTDKEYTPNYPVRGTSSRLIHAAAYYDPSLRGVRIDQSSGQLAGGGLSAVEPGQGGTLGV